MKAVLVAGGAGAVGEGIVRGFLANGWEALVPSRSLKHLDELRERLGFPEHLKTFEADLTSPEQTELSAAVKGHDLAAAAVSVGGWWQGANLIDVDLETWNGVLAKVLTSHFMVCKAVVPHLKARLGDASLTLIGGNASEEPVAGAGPTSIAGAAQIMLSRVLALELGSTPVRVNELVMGPVATRKVTDPGPNWITPDDVGCACEKLAADGKTRGEAIRIYDALMLRNRFG